MHETGKATLQDTEPRRARIGVAVTLGVLFVLALVTVVGSAPFVCTACHGAQTAAMDASAHVDTDCYACHLVNGAWGLPGQKTEELFRMYPARLVGRNPARPASMTARDACLECHADVLDAVTPGAKFRIDHRTCAPDPTCDGCHATTAHGTSLRWQVGPVMEACVACHSEKAATTECDTCHAGDKTRRSVETTSGAWQVTHNANWDKAHGLGDIDTCATCHPDDYCTRCHGIEVPHPRDFGGTHGTLATSKPGACAKCHRSSKDFCDACHSMEMPHPEGFLPKHASIAKGREDARCYRCHADRDCATCHEAHVHPGGSTGVPVPWTITPEGQRQ